MLVDLILVFSAAVLSAIITHILPKTIVPEGILLIGIGCALGPHVFGLIHPDDAVTLMANFGLGLMFLLAGYELPEGSNVRRSQRGPLYLWALSPAVALLIGWALSALHLLQAPVMDALAVVTTALGTIMPIIKSRGISPSSAFGRSVITHGTAGQIGPPVALMIVLGLRGNREQAIALVILLIVLGVLLALPGLLRRHAPKLVDAIRSGSDSQSQTDVRIITLLILSMLALASTYHIDLILAAFLMGVVIRQSFPAERSDLGEQLYTISFGVFIPIFYVFSGLNINVFAIARSPATPLIFLAAIILLRFLPVFIYARHVSGLRAVQAAQVGLYSSVGLSLVAAITQVAVRDGQMSVDTRAQLIVAACVAVALFTGGAAALARKDAAASGEPVPAAPQDPSHIGPTAPSDLSAGQ